MTPRPRIVQSFACALLPIRGFVLSCETFREMKHSLLAVARKPAHPAGGRVSHEATEPRKKGR